MDWVVILVFRVVRADSLRWAGPTVPGPARIDPGYDPAMKTAFEALGLADLLH